MAISMSIVVFVGFSRSFFLRSVFPQIEELAAPEPVFYSHGVLFSTWLILLILQPYLVRTGNVHIHRRFGVFGAVLAGAMVFVGILGSLLAAARPGGFIGVSLPPEQFLAIPFFDIVLFGLFVWLAVSKRREPEVHKRLMLIATINLLEVAFTRYPFDFIAQMAPTITFVLTDIFVILIVVWDRVSTGDVHKVTLWAGILTILSQPYRLMIMDTEPWQAFARWMIDLVA